MDRGYNMGQHRCKIWLLFSKGKFLSLRLSFLALEFRDIWKWTLKSPYAETNAERLFLSFNAGLFPQNRQGRAQVESSVDSQLQYPDLARQTDAATMLTSWNITPEHCWSPQWSSLISYQMLSTLYMLSLSLFLNAPRDEQLNTSGNAHSTFIWLWS